MISLNLRGAGEDEVSDWLKALSQQPESQLPTSQLIDILHKASIYQSNDYTLAEIRCAIKEIYPSLMES